jgi:hypothetical protein
MCFLYDEQLDARQDHFRFGFETGRIARSIAAGKGFASPLYYRRPIDPLLVTLAVSALKTGKNKPRMERM